MTNDIPVSLISCFVILLLLSAIAAIVLKKLKFPFSIGLVIIGLVLGIITREYGWFATLGSVHLTPNIILYILLPTLVFEAAVNIDVRLLIKNLTPVMTLALPGLVIATLITGALISLFTPLPIGPAMLFGGLISATDPVAVIAVFKELGAPKRLTMLVDGESLFNDATAIVMFDIILGLLAGGAVFGVTTLFEAGLKFIMVFIGGGLVGVLVGYIMMQLLTLAKDDPLVKIAFTTVIAYAAFIIAQYYLNLSGVMAAVGAGLVVGYYGSTRFSPTVKAYIKQFWEFASFAANCYIFLLLGLTEDYLSHNIMHVVYIITYVLIAIVVVIIARAVIIFGIIPGINSIKQQHKIGKSYQTIIFWGGLRGALPIGLAMSLSATDVGGEVNRILIMDFTLGVVLFTLLVQGTTISWVMNKLGLNKLSKLEKLEKKKTHLIIKKKGLGKIDSMAKQWPNIDKKVLNSICNDYKTNIVQMEADLQYVQFLHGSMNRKVLWLEIINTFNHTIRRMYDLKFFSEVVLRKFEYTLELCREDIDNSLIPPPHAKQMLSDAWSVSLPWTTCMLRFIPIAYFRNKREALQLIMEYTINFAVVEGIRVLQRDLPKLVEYSGVDEKSAEASRIFLDKINQKSLIHIRSLFDRSYEQVILLHEKALRHMGLVTENSVLGEIYEYGGVSSKVVELLSCEIEKMNFSSGIKYIL